MLTLTQLMVTLPTNTKEGLVKLLNAQGVKTVLASGDQIRPMQDAADSIPNGGLLEMPPLASFLDAVPHAEYPCDRNWSQIKNDTWMVMQSSGMLTVITTTRAAMADVL